MSLSLYPHVGTLGTAAGRTAILAPVFSGEWLPPLILYGGESFLIPDPADFAGDGESFLIPDPTDLADGGQSVLIPDPADLAGGESVLIL